LIPDPKPLPVGRHRLERLCTCGRRIDPREHIALDMVSLCSGCYGRQRRWWRRRVTLWERFRAWLLLRAWKRRRPQ